MTERPLLDRSIPPALPVSPLNVPPAGDAAMARRLNLFEGAALAPALYSALTITRTRGFP
jgi:hypothetical protein